MHLHRKIKEIRQSSATLVALLLAFSCPSGAAILSVDARNTACVDSGTGTSAVPFCTVMAASRRAVTGDVVLVKPGEYSEQITPSVSGTAGQPITYRAAGTGVTIVGTDDITNPSEWSATTTGAWKRPLSSAPKQIFLDGARLGTATSARTTVMNTFFYDGTAKLLYVDVGGANPGIGHTLEASTRNYGFSLVGVHDIVVDGFSFRGHDIAALRLSSAASITGRNLTIGWAAENGVRVDGRSSSVMLDAISVSNSGSIGILVMSSTAITLSRSTSHDNGNHGISLQNVSDSVVAGNTVYQNRRLNIRGAAGIDINSGSTNNTISSNSAYSNQDSGIQVYNSSQDNVVVRNASWLNEDHGFDTNQSLRTQYISNTSFGNRNDGFSVEGGSTGTHLANNIAMDNGLTTGEYDLFVDGPSVANFSSDYDLFYKSGVGVLIRFNGTSYLSVPNFRLGTGQEGHGISADPKLMGPSSANLHLEASSPALDSANAAVPGFVLADHNGVLPFDDPAVPNTGAGTPPFADRGAFERTTSGTGNHPPSASLTLTPTSAVTGQTVMADASSSSDTDAAPIASYRFDFGDGFLVGPQSEATAVHAYGSVGVFPVTVTVTDTAGESDTATASVTVTSPTGEDLPPTAVLGVTPSSGPINLRVTADASGSTDVDATPIASYRFNFGDGTLVGPQVAPTAIHVYAALGDFTVTVTVTDTAGKTDTATATVSVLNSAPVASLKLKPSSGPIDLKVTADATESTDRDHNITRYRFDFGDGTIVGPQSGAMATHTYRVVGTYTVTLTVIDAFGLTSTAQRRVVVEDDPPTVVLRRTPSSGRPPLAVTVDASGSYDDDATPIVSYRFDFEDGTVVGPQSSPIAVHTYSISGHFQIMVTVRDSAGNTSTGRVNVTIRKLRDGDDEDDH